MFSRATIWLIPAALFASVLRAEEQNIWPVSVRQEQPAGTVVSTEHAGPLFFNYKIPGEPEENGFRPFYMHTKSGDIEASYLLYPFFTWRKGPGYSSFSFFQLANNTAVNDPGHLSAHALDIWPIYFSRDTGDPGTSYRALFPIGGTVLDRLGYDRFHFILFPLYLETEKGGRHTTHAPWPFLRFINQGGEHGFEFWPLFGHRGRPDDYDERFYLWPLIYKSTEKLSEPQPEVKFGILPFYSLESAPGYLNENYGWPFFGYTHRTAPVKYDEKRYFWPFLVQGRGDVSYVNRWGPIYTHSIIKGYDKTWFAWPLFRHARWTESGVHQEKNQVLFFVYWSLTQHSVANPNAAPAHKTHLWPLFSSWDNGAGRRQLQVFSLFEAPLPNNEPIRQLYSPLFAIYRFDQRAPDDSRGSVLFSLLTWKNSPSEKEFHVGPLFSRRSTPEAARIAIGNGIFAWQRQGDAGRWKFSLFDFHPKADNSPSQAPTP